MEKRTAYLGFRVEKSLLVNLNANAKREGLPVAAVIRLALRAYLDPKKSRNGGGK